MTTPLTFSTADPSGRRTPRWAVGLAAMLIGVAAPTVACEKSRPALIAGQGEPQTVATFTGEFVNGAPVYRFPTITVVTRRALEVAKTPRDGSQPRAVRSRASAPAAQTPKGKVASASREASAINPCIG